MAEISGLWLNHLKSHPIFTISNPESEKSTCDSAFRKKKNVLVLDNFFLIGISGQIRVLDLRLVKKITLDCGNFQESVVKTLTDLTSKDQFNIKEIVEALKLVPYIVIAEFGQNEIYQISVNSSKSLLSVLASNGLFIVDLNLKKWKSFYETFNVENPESGTGKIFLLKKPSPVGVFSNEAKLPTSLSSTIENSDDSTPTTGKKHPIDLFWHPLSLTRSHLVILFSSGLVEMYDVLTDILIPEQSFTIFSKNNHSTFTFSQAVSFAMGQPDKAGWERLTLFVVTNDCDIYYATPFVPNKCIFEKRWIDEMLIKCQIEASELISAQQNVGSDVTAPPELYDALNSFEWINYVNDYYKSSTNKSDHDSLILKSSYYDPIYDHECVINFPSNYYSNLSFQEPLLLIPAPCPVETYLNNSSSFDRPDKLNSVDDVCDILVLGTSPVTIIATSLYGSFVNLFALINTITPSWKSRNIKVLGNTSRKPLSLFSLESIDLNSSDALQTGYVFLSSSCVSSNYFFAGSPSGLFQINVKKWVQKFSDKLEPNNDESSSPESHHSKETIENNSGNQLSDSNDTSHPTPDLQSDLVSFMNNLSIDNSGSSFPDYELFSSVNCLISLGKGTQHKLYQPFTGILEIVDNYCSYSLLALIGKNVPIGMSMLFPEEERLLNSSWLFNYQNFFISTDDKKSSCKYTLNLDQSESIEDLESSISLALSSLNSFEPSFKGLDTKKSLPLIKNSSTVSEETLHTLGSFASKIRSVFSNIETINAKLLKRIELQNQEFDRQKARLRELSEPLKNSSDFYNEKVLARVITLIRNNTKIVKRMEDMTLNFLKFHDHLKFIFEERFSRFINYEKAYRNNGSVSTRKDFENIIAKVKKIDVAIKIILTDIFSVYNNLQFSEFMGNTNLNPGSSFNRSSKDKELSTALEYTNWFSNKISYLKDAENEVKNQLMQITRVPLNLNSV
ncbi:hypothetical protein BB560_006950 [Smittium megazygosporum]|uniref:Uncharacterized protein n=1 Tax=Smittium megazygosporum TaxID=133381 RepID=A0A2T9Y042_9FUNG|nr:hypothetical protein BB560_006950 [Smittium megazygosporum]